MTDNNNGKVNCLECGQLVIQKTTRQKWCSDACKWKQWKRLHDR